MRAIFYGMVLILSSGLAIGQTYKALYSFGSNPNDAALANQGLVFDDAGNLYGSSRAGGNSGTTCAGGACGTIFELSPQADGSWVEQVIYSFCENGQNNVCPDGWQPNAGLLIDSVGNLYGTTAFGGSYSFCPDSFGCGTVFELSPPSSPGAPNSR